MPLGLVIGNCRLDHKTINFFTTGRYALVDAYYRYIWINTYDEVICHRIQQLFWSKIQTLVYDLNTVEQYHDGLIDTSVCLNWQLLDVDRLPMRIGLNIAGFDQTHQGGKLVNIKPEYPLPVERQHDLQQQMLLYKTIMDWTHKTLTPGDLMIVSKIDQIFQTEINLNDINQELFTLANQYLYNAGWLSGVILTQLDRHYE